MNEPSLPDPAWKWWHGNHPIRLGVSSCLLGQEVRHDGGHKWNRYFVEVLGRYFEWVPVCPEFEIGLGVPRPTIRLEGNGTNPRLIMPSTGRDLTERMETYARRRVRELQALDSARISHKLPTAAGDAPTHSGFTGTGPSQIGSLPRDLATKPGEICGLDGFLLKSSSPSCGMERVEVFGEGRSPAKRGVGAFARILMEMWPTLPIEEERRLDDPELRERFIEQVFCRRGWRVMMRRDPSRDDLAAFHAAHELLLRAHNETACRRLGHLIQGGRSLPKDRLFSNYEDQFQRVLATKATTKRHSKVLYHILGRLKRHLNSFEEQELVRLIEDYGKGLAPLAGPITLLRHHVLKNDVDSLKGRLYLEPHPAELMLRNRV